MQIRWWICLQTYIRTLLGSEWTIRLNASLTTVKRVEISDMNEIRRKGGPNEEVCEASNIIINPVSRRSKISSPMNAHLSKCCSKKIHCNLEHWKEKRLTILKGTSQRKKNNNKAIMLRLTHQNWRWKGKTLGFTFCFLSFVCALTYLEIACCNLNKGMFLTFQYKYSKDRLNYIVSKENRTIKIKMSITRSCMSIYNLVQSFYVGSIPAKAKISSH